MVEEAKQTVARILSGQVIASLGTLHSGEPAVSMVPFAWTTSGVLVVHVSRLASHTADMLAHPRVSMLVVDAASAGVMPQAIARISVAADAERLENEDAAEERDAYIARFPDAEPLLQLGDFSFFAIRPRNVRVIAGFGRATTLSAEQFIAVAAAS